jgi:hypothetical protein
MVVTRWVARDGASRKVCAEYHRQGTIEKKNSLIEQKLLVQRRDRIAIKWDEQDNQIWLRRHHSM